MATKKQVGFQMSHNTPREVLCDKSLVVRNACVWVFFALPFHTPRKRQAPEIRLHSQATTGFDEHKMKKKKHNTPPHESMINWC